MRKVFAKTGKFLIIGRKRILEKRGKFLLWRKFWASILHLRKPSDPFLTKLAVRGVLFRGLTVLTSKHTDSLQNFHGNLWILVWLHLILCSKIKKVFNFHSQRKKSGKFLTLGRKRNFKKSGKFLPNRESFCKKRKVYTRKVFEPHCKCPCTQLHNQ